MKRKHRTAADLNRELERDEAIYAFLTSRGVFVGFLCVGLVILVLIWRLA